MKIIIHTHKKTKINFSMNRSTTLLKWSFGSQNNLLVAQLLSQNTYQNNPLAETLFKRKREQMRQIS